MKLVPQNITHHYTNASINQPKPTNQPTRASNDDFALSNIYNIHTPSSKSTN
ncbi:hypothetical protein Hanom_Chr05g00473021 [Helianthus anomalus]